MSHQRLDRIVHQLPEYEASGYPPPYEYPLPARIEECKLAILHPWLHALATLTPADAHASLQARWNGLRNAGLCRVRDHLLECKAISIVITGERAWLLCVHENGAMYCIGPPGDRQKIAEQQERRGIGGNSLLTDLIVHFGGLREDFAPSSGYFIDERNWEFIDQPWMGEEVQGYAEWKDSLILFHSRGGDVLLQHPSGRAGWWVADEIRMRYAYENLEAALVDFTRYKKVAWPFDPYKPRK